MAISRREYCYVNFNGFKRGAVWFFFFLSFVFGNISHIRYFVLNPFDQQSRRFLLGLKVVVLQRKIRGVCVQAFRGLMQGRVKTVFLE